ncbi:uncharacterized protein BDV17DRAFT_233924 [Aspergillus undulatus]|uniref:uncharacterized protein n=1 Tax=Aspergillus undulatus TaxID=1810928 RepID=UPI003CCD92E9
MLVVNGWDGLTSNAGVFQSLFTPYNDAEVTLRIYIAEEHIFYEVSVEDALWLLNGDDEEGEEIRVSASTRLFVARMHAIFADKMRLSIANTELHTHSHNRKPRPTEKPGPTCSICGR